MTDDEMVDTLLAACRRQHEKGCLLAQGDFGVTYDGGRYRVNGALCPLGALVADRATTSYVIDIAAAELLGVSLTGPDWTFLAPGIADGFDDPGLALAIGSGTAKDRFIAIGARVYKQLRAEGLIL